MSKDEITERFLKDSNVILNQFKQLQMNTLKSLQNSSLSSGSIGAKTGIAKDDLLEKQLKNLSLLKEDEDIYCRCDEDHSIQGNEKVMCDDDFCKCEKPVPVSNNISSKLVPKMYEGLVTIKEKNSN